MKNIKIASVLIALYGIFVLVNAIVYFIVSSGETDFPKGVIRAVGSFVVAYYLFYKKDKIAYWLALIGSGLFSILGVLGTILAIVYVEMNPLIFLNLIPVGLLLSASILLIGKKTRMEFEKMPNDLRFSQLDITERFDDRSHLGPEEWIETTPLDYHQIHQGVKINLTSLKSPDEIYKIAVGMSGDREIFNNDNDGVYCPICHKANINLKKIETPCPTCGRPLLRFGWN